MLLIGAILGWGASLYRRYQGITSTPFAVYFTAGFGDDITAVLKERGAPIPEHSLGVGSGALGPSSTHREMTGDLQLPSREAAMFVDSLMKRARAKIVASGCREYGMASRSSSDPDEGFSLHYRRDTTAGSILVYVVRIDEQHVRLVAVLDEHRAP